MDEHTLFLWGHNAFCGPVIVFPERLEARNSMVGFRAAIFQNL